MQLLKQSTAASLIVGPILDSTGVEYASAVIGDISLSKNGATLTALASAATLTYIANGLYTLALTTGNTDTLGRAEIFCNKSTYQMPPVRLTVLAAAPFDTLVTNGTLASTTSGRTIVTDASGLVDANAVKVGPTGSGTAQTARDLGQGIPNAVPGASGGLVIAGSNAATTFAGLTTGALACTTVTASGAVAFQSTFAVTTSTALAALSCSTLTASGAVAFQSTFVVTSGVTFTAGLTSNITGTLGTVTTLTNLPAITAGWLTATGIAADAITAGKIADGAIDTATFSSGCTIPRVTLADTLTTYTGNTLQTGDSFALIGTAGAGLTALGDTRLGNLDAAVSTRLAASDYTAAPSAATIADAVRDVSNGSPAAGSLGEACRNADAKAAVLIDTVGTPANVTVSADIAALTVDTAAVKAKTNNLPSDPADASDVAAAFVALASHGDLAWATASGFATAGAQMALVDGAITEAKISTPAEAAGRPTGVLGMLRRLFEWRANQRTRNRSTGTVTLLNAANAAALETQTQSTSGAVDTQTKGV